VEKYLNDLLERDSEIDTIILGCTHYPLIQSKIEAYLSLTNRQISVVSQGEIVAHSLADYLHRHPEIVERISSPLEGRLGGGFLTTESATKFSESASLFLAEPIQAQHIEL
jgi:glutamate racemase